MKKLLAVTTLALAALAPLPLLAQSHGAHHGAAAAAADATADTLTTGEVRKIDTAAAKVTLRHEAINNLGMPPMTMVFQVADPSLLTGLKVGDSVRFAVERAQTGLTVTRIEKAAP